MGFFEFCLTLTVYTDWHLDDIKIFFSTVQDSLSLETVLLQVYSSVLGTKYCHFQSFNPPKRLNTYYREGFTYLTD